MYTACTVMHTRECAWVVSDILTAPPPDLALDGERGLDDGAERADHRRREAAEQRDRGDVLRVEHACAPQIVFSRFQSPGRTRT